MKRYNLYTLLFALLGCLAFNSCADDEFVRKDNSKVEEGIPVGLKLSFEPEETAKVTTKVAIDEAEENKVFDLRVFIFKKGVTKLESKLEFTNLYTFDGSASGSIDIAVGNITSGEKYIYAIANTASNSISSVADYSSVKTLGDLNELTASLTETTVQRLTGRLLMGGYYGDNEDEGYCKLDASAANSSSVISLSNFIYLKHLDSRIRFEVTTASSLISFVPRTWKVVNVPVKSYLIEQDEDAVSSDSESDYFSFSAESFDSKVLDGIRYRGGAFTFYMFENRKEAINNGRSYEDREKQEKLGSANGDYIYAHKYATYVEMTGTYNEFDEKGVLGRSGEVKYTVHLGYVEGVNDFKSKRNHSYTYKVNIVGVNNIIVEVDSGKEEQAGAEGDIVIADQNLYLDAHYETRMVTFNKNALENMSVKVTLPGYRTGDYTYSLDKSGNVTVSGGTKEEVTSNMKWVQFVRNPKSGEQYYREDVYSAFPGVANQLGDIEDDDSNKYLTIDQVLQLLYSHKGDSGTDFWDEGGKVVYTVFIDENYYKDDESNWNTFVNVSNRQMHILCDTKYSPDHESSVTRSSILINQRSIKSIYNTGSGHAVSAWGIETVNETGKLKVDNSHWSLSDASRTNGLYDMYKQIKWNAGDTSWSGYVDFTSTKDKKLIREKAIFACLQRNRDLNGNGKIDHDEIRWYLPAINQYSGLWLGKDALDPEAQLFQGDATKIADGYQYGYHYFSSDGIRFWSEEGASTGTNGAGGDKPINVRCARNLGLYEGAYTKPSKSKEPKDFVQYERYKGGFVSVVDLTYLSPASFRDHIDDQQVSHTEHSGVDLNRPYKKFEVYKERTTDCSKLGKGWRIPNQRELSLIAGYSTAEIKTKIFSNTRSDLPYKTGKYYGSNSNGGINIITLSEGISNSYRCVKDK